MKQLKFIRLFTALTSCFLFFISDVDAQRGLRAVTSTRVPQQAIYSCTQPSSKPSCNDCSNACMNMHVAYHCISVDELVNRAYPDGPTINIGRYYTRGYIERLMVQVDFCADYAFICSDFSADSDMIHFNDNISVSVVYCKVFNPAYASYNIQVIKGLLDSFPLISGFYFYNGRKINSTDGDILFEAVDIYGNTVYCGDLSSDYPPCKKNTNKTKSIN